MNRDTKSHRETAKKESGIRATSSIDQQR